MSSKSVTKTAAEQGYPITQDGENGILPFPTAAGPGGLAGSCVERNELPAPLVGQTEDAVAEAYR